MSFISPHWIELGCSIGSLILLLIAAVSLSKIQFAQMRAGGKPIQDAQQLSKLLGIVAAILVFVIAYMYYASYKTIAIDPSTMDNMLTAVRVCNISAFLIVCMISYNLSKVNPAMFVGSSRQHYNNASKSMTGYIVVMILCYMFKLGKQACNSGESKLYIGGDYY